MAAHSRISARGIIIKENHLLVEYDANRGVCFPPGGRLEVGELPEQALIRELVEELGDQAFRIGRYLGQILSRWREDSSICEAEDHFFEILECHLRVDSTVATTEKGREFRWLPLASLTQYGLMPPELVGLVSDLNALTRPWKVSSSEV